MQYVDKTFLDLMGKHNLEPVVFTFSFFNRKARSDPRNWVIAGFVTQLGKTAKQKKFMEKGQTSTIFHQQMRVIMRDMASHGWKATMQMQMCGKKEIKRLVLFLLVVIGDGQGSDLMCGRYLSYNNNNGRIIWQCHCPPKETSEFQTAYGQSLEEYIDNRCKYVVSDTVEKLVCDANDETSATKEVSLMQLHAMAQQKTYLWTFGDYVPIASREGGGIFGSCHIDNLHAIKGGLFPKLSETILSRLTPKMMEAVDTFVYPQLFGNNKQSHVQDKFFRTTFRSLCEMSKMTSMEKAGHLFSWMIVTRSGIGATLFTMARYGTENGIQDDPDYFSHKDGDSWLYFRHDNELQTFGRVFEMALTFDQFVSNPGDHLWNANADVQQVTESEFQCDNKIGAMMGCITWVFPKQLHLPVDENGNRRPDSSRIRKKRKKKKTRGEADNASRRKTGNENTNSVTVSNLTVNNESDEVDLTGTAMATITTDNDLDDNYSAGAMAALEELLRISWNSQKFHALRHVSRSITSLGPILGFDSSAGEHNHTHWAKTPGTTAVKRKTRHKFQTTTGTRVVDKLAIDHANRKFGKHACLDVTGDNSEMSSTDHGTKFYIKLGNGVRMNKPKVYKRPKHWNKATRTPLQVFEGLPETVVGFIDEKYHHLQTDDDGDVDLLCSTELRIVEGDRVIDVVRCHPDYIGEGRRYDWVNIRWEFLKGYIPRYERIKYQHMKDDAVVPCQLACVIIGVGSESHATIDPTVVVRITVDKEQDTKCPPPRSAIMTRWTKMYTAERAGLPVFALVAPMNIERQVICYEDFPTTFGEYKEFFFARKKFMETWLKKEYCFEKFMKGTKYIYDDFVYSVRPKEEWPEIFNYLCRNTRDETTERFYVPPDQHPLVETTVNSDQSDTEEDE